MMIIDMHCDTVLKAYQEKCRSAFSFPSAHFDLSRMQGAGVKIQFFALFPGLSSALSPYRQAILLADYFGEQLQKNSGIIRLITSRQSLLQVIDSPQRGALLTAEGGEVLEGNLRKLGILYQRGVRSLCLTWNHRNEIADGAAEIKPEGLTLFGRQVVKEMNNLGMVIDLSHIAEPGFWDVLELSAYPVLASHSNSRFVWEHARNLTDDQIRGIAQRNGVVGLNFVADFLGKPGSGPEQLLRHIDHICGLVGDDYLGFGSDFDGTDNLLTGIKDVTFFSEFIAYLYKQNYKETTIRKLCGENVLRLLQEIL
jgi:membrane dipeptidase